MTISSKTFAPRLLAGVGTAALVAAVGLFASSRPAHTAGGPIAVAVSNTVQTQNVDNPAKQPVQIQKPLTQSNTYTVFYTVPPHKRLVIEYVNLFSNNPSDPNKYNFILATNGVYTDFTLTPDGSPYVGASQKVLLYADAGNEPYGYFQYNGSNDSPEIYVTLTGYLVDVP